MEQSSVSGLTEEYTQSYMLATQCCQPMQVDPVYLNSWKLVLYYFVNDEALS